MGMTEKVIETVNGWYMENPKQKVELEDIIGLVKTDEPTDSVQLKKEAQLSICEKRIIELEKENEQLKSTMKEVTELLEEEVDLFSDKATEHDIHAYVELKELDNKDAFYMATATKKAIKMLKELQRND